MPSSAPCLHAPRHRGGDVRHLGYREDPHQGRHGATGKGNDQVRFELTYYALKPDVTVIAPWREWDLTSRTRLIEFAEKHQIPFAKDKRGDAPFSVDANLLHTSSEGKVLEDPGQDVPEYVFSRTVDPEKAPDKPTTIIVDFERGDAVAVDGKKMTPAVLLKHLNDLGRANGIGRLDLVENRFVGMLSRNLAVGVPPEALRNLSSLDSEISAEFFGSSG